MSIKILFIIQDLNGAGAQHQLVDLAIGMSRLGYTCYIFTFSNKLGLLDKIFNESIRFFNVPRKNKFDILFVIDMIKLIKKINFDIIHCTLDLAYVFGWVAFKLARSKASFICTVHTHISLLDDMKLRIWALLYVPIFKKCNRLIFVCENQKNIWVKKFSIDPKITKVIYNGVSVNKYIYSMNKNHQTQLKNKYKISKYDIIFVLVARFRPEKRHDLAIAGMEKAYRSNNNIKIVFVGDGPTLEHTKKLCLNSANPKMFVFAGNQTNVFKYLAISDCFLLCSDAESFSIATLEAMAMGLPVISSNVGGQSEMIKTGFNGLLFNPGNVDDLAKCIKSIESNPAYAKIMGKNAERLFINKFTSDEMFDKYSCLFESLSK